MVWDISWLSFNARVLQEAADTENPLYERIHFSGIFSNNLDEFFRIRVATLKRMLLLKKPAKMHLENDPAGILDEIQKTVVIQQQRSDQVWKDILNELRKRHVFIKTETHLNKEHQLFIQGYFLREVRPRIIPLIPENMKGPLNLHDKSIYLAVALFNEKSAKKRIYSLIEIPTGILPRFIMLPSKSNQKNIILLEDIIRFCMPSIFPFFNYDRYSTAIIKLTRDAEMDIDNDISVNVIDQIRKGLKERKRGKPVRLTFDQEIEPQLLKYLMRNLQLTKHDSLIPGSRIHNFKDFMHFPLQVLSGKDQSHRRAPFIHPLLANSDSLQKVVLKRDVLLNFPYHSFNSLVDLLREAAIDPTVRQIKITAYRLAQYSQIIHALVSAANNGKEVIVIIELRARFDEEVNLHWKTILEEEGVKVHIGIPDMKVHTKVCVITKLINNDPVLYGFISTGNLNEDTAKYYSDFCLLTADKQIMACINRLFKWLEVNNGISKQPSGNYDLMVSPSGMRKQLIGLIDREIRHVKNKKPAAVLLKMNSLTDNILINKLYQAAAAGVEIRIIVRGICCVISHRKHWKRDMNIISIVDEYLEHARVFIFHNKGKEETYLSSADWMIRNLDHRVETTVHIKDEMIKKELKEYLELQFKDNVKARTMDNNQQNVFKIRNGKKIRSQVIWYQTLKNKIYST
ncbi:MAG: polyphosphate kinase 1 [Chitinophagaceae bacterium]|nr:MAG: polyphosphate kinase 1 [Chitinophagaceae bacterium]